LIQPDRGVRRAFGCSTDRYGHHGRGRQHAAGGRRTLSL